MQTELLQVEPADPQFLFRVGSTLVTTIHLTNLTDSRLSVQILKPSRRLYRVSNEKFTILPGCAGDVQINCEALKSKPSSGDTFTVEATVEEANRNDQPAAARQQKQKVIVRFVDPPAQSPPPKILPGPWSVWGKGKASTPSPRARSVSENEVSPSPSPNPLRHAASDSEVETLTAVMDKLKVQLLESEEDRKSKVSELEVLKKEHNSQMQKLQSDLKALQNGAGGNQQQSLRPGGAGGAGNMADAKRKLEENMEIKVLKEELNNEVKRADNLQLELSALRSGAGNNLRSSGPGGSSTGSLPADERKAYEQKLADMQNERDANKESKVAFYKSLLVAKAELKELKDQQDGARKVADDDQLALQEKLKQAQVDFQAQKEELDQLRSLCSEALAHGEALKQERDRTHREHGSMVEMMQQEHRQRLLDMELKFKQMESCTSSTPADLQEVAKLEIELKAMRETCASGIQQIERLQDDLEELNEELKGERAEKARLLRDLQALQVRKEMVEAEGQRIKDALEESQEHRSQEPVDPGELDILRENLKKQERLKTTAVQKLVEEQQRVRQLRAELDAARGGVRSSRASSLNSALTQDGSGSSSLSTSSSVEDLRRLEIAEKRLAELEQLLAERDARIEDLSAGPTRQRRSLSGWAPNGSVDSATSEGGLSSVDDDSLEGRLREYKEENANMAEEVGFLTRDKEQMSNTIFNLTKKMAAHAQSEESVKQLQEDLARAEAEQSRLQAELGELEAEKLTWGDASAEQQEQLEQLRWDNNDLQRQLRDLQTQNQDLERQVAELKAAAEAAQGEAPELERVQGEKEELLREVLELEATLRRTEESYSELERYVDSLQIQVQNLQEQKGAIEVEAQRRAGAEILLLREEVNRARDQTSDLLKQMEDMVARHQAVVAGLEGTVADLQAQQGAGAARQLSLPRGPSPEVAAQLAELERRCREKDEEMQKLQTALKQSEESFNYAKERLELDLLDAQDRERELRQRERELQDKLDGRGDEVEQYKEALERAKAKVQAAREEKAAVEESAERAQSELQELQSQLVEQMAATAEAQRNLRQQQSRDAADREATAADLKNMYAIVQSLQQDSEEAINARNLIENFLLKLEVHDVLRRGAGHTLRIRERPAYTCTICRRPGTGWAWKCSNSQCADIIHPQCILGPPR